MTIERITKETIAMQSKGKIANIFSTYSNYLSSLIDRRKHQTGVWDISITEETYLELKTITMKS